MLYLIIVLLSMNIYSWWWMWLTFEITNWLLIVIMNSPYVLLFLVLQSLFSLFIVFSLMFMKKLLLFVLIAKMGLPPFHSWVVNNQLTWSFHGLVLFISLHKWLPSLIFLNFLNFIWISFIFMMSFVLFWFNNNFKLFIFGISTNDTGWLILSWCVSLKMYLFYLVLNFFMFALLTSMNAMTDTTGLDMQLVLLFLLGLPPFSSFLIKWMILSNSSLFLSGIALYSAWFMLIMIWYWLSLKLLLMKFFHIKTNFSFVIILSLLSFWLLN